MKLRLSLALLVFLQNALFTAGGQVPLQVPPRAGSGPAGPVLDEEFDAWIQETGRGWGMKGVAIAVVRKDEQGLKWITETKGYGVADRRGNVVNEDTLFRIASNSKLFTALAVGLLTTNESLSLEWNTKIRDILPLSAWSLDDEIATNNADLTDILSHRTGMPRHDLSFGRRDTVETFLTKQRYLRSSSEFRGILQYNNQMYTLASHIVSRLSDMPFTAYVMHNIFSPLGLSSTTYNKTNAVKSGNFSEGFVNAGTNKEKGDGRRKTLFWPIPYEDYSDLIAGPGGAISSAKDMATWLQALLLQGRSPSTLKPIIPAAIVDKVAQGITVYQGVSIFPEISPVVYGMGQYRFSYRGHELIEHAGDLPGYHSVLTRFPNDNVAVAVLTNWDDGEAFRDVIRGRIFDKVFGLTPIDWNERYHQKVDKAEARKAERKSRLPDAKPPTVAYRDLAGLYFNPAYGTLSFCAYPPPNDLCSREECDNLILDARSSLRSFLNDSAPTLIAASSNFLYTHVLLRHFSGDIFNASAAHAYPAPFTSALGSDEDNLPFAVETEKWNVEFIFGEEKDALTRKVEGIAWKGGVWGASEDIDSPIGEGKEGAEVWFDRIN